MDTVWKWKLISVSGLILALLATGCSTVPANMWAGGPTLSPSPSRTSSSMGACAGGAAYGSRGPCGPQSLSVW